MVENTVTVYYPTLNLPTIERYDFVYWVIGNLCGFNLGQFYLFYQIILSFCGGYFLFKVIGCSSKDSFLKSILLLLAILVVVGLNPFYLKCGWLLFIVGGFLWTFNDPRWERVACSFLFLTLFVVNAGAYAPTGLIFAAIVVSLYCPRIFAFIVGNKIGLLYGGLCIAFFLGVYTLPFYLISGYPSDARLAPISPLANRGYPLIGPYFELVPLVYIEYLSQLWNSLLSFVIVISSFYIIPLGGSGFLGRLKESKAGLIIAAIFFVIIASEFYQARIPFDYNPYWLAWRLIPGIAAQENPILLLMSGIVGCSIFGANVKLVNNALGIVIGVVLIFFVNSSGTYRSFPSSNYELGKERVGVWGKNYETGYVQKVYGDWVVRKNIQKERSRENLVILENGLDVNISVVASKQSDKAVYAIDNNSKTRWSTGGPQKEGDQISFNFDRPVDLVRFVLSLGEAKADFPRGIRIIANTSDGNEIELLNQSDWQGPVKWTEKGLPYFGGQGDVTIEFPVQIKATGIKVIQTGRSSTFDWSIAEAKFYRLK